MPDNPASMLLSCAARVLEDTAFVLTEPAKEPPAEQEGAVRACIRFHGSREGFLQAIVPVEACTVLAANMLGVDPEDADASERGHDALKEILNILCGTVLGEAFPGSNMAIGLPTLCAAQKASLASGPGDTFACLLTEEGFPVTFVLHVDAEQGATS